MSVIEIIGLVLATLAVIGLVAWVIFRLEVRKETKARARSHHDSALGKDSQYLHNTLSNGD